MGATSKGVCVGEEMAVMQRFYSLDNGDKQGVYVCVVVEKANTVHVHAFAIPYPTSSPP